MESPESRTFAQFGGALILVSLALPWFALSLAGLGSQGFRVWTFDKGAFVLIAAYGLLAIAQVRMSSRSSMALIYLIIGGLMTSAFIYKIWISPPGSAPIGDLGGASGVSGVSAKDVLEAIGIEMKASYGAYVAFVGSLLFTFGAFTEYRAAGSSPKSAPTIGLVQANAPQQPVAPAQRYRAPAPQAFAPDPFAPPASQAAVAQAGAPQIPPDPFAPPTPPAS
ncbi:MAG: hypothetical protein JHD02_03705 [Thermoleophilaceae bacterium]|nr:hypothetical protein [Thermoleophilaceae bacterium]